MKVGWIAIWLGIWWGCCPSVAAQKTYSVEGRFYDCANNNTGGLSELPQLYSDTTFLYAIHPSDSGTFQLQNLKPGPYRIKYKWLFIEHNYRHFDVYDKDIPDLLVCVDSLPKSRYQETVLAEQINAANKLRVHYGYFVKGEQKQELIMLSKKGKKFVAKLSSDEEKISKVIDTEELAAFERILTEIGNLELPDLCSENTYYYISFRTKDYNVTDPSCTWNGYERLKKIVFR